MAGFGADLVRARKASRFHPQTEVAGFVIEVVDRSEELLPAGSAASFGELVRPRGAIVELTRERDQLVSGIAVAARRRAPGGA